MKSLDEDELERAIDMLAAGDSARDVAAAFGLAVDELPSVGARIVERATLDRDPVALTLGMRVGRQTKVTDVFLAPLLAVADADWHHYQEDVISALDDVRHPEAIDAFVHAALTKYPFRAYDTYGALATKALWGLGNLATAESVAAIEKIARETDVPQVHENAIEQLERVAEEASDETVRAAAQAAAERVRRS